MLEEQISKDYVQSMKDKNTIKSSTLNFLRAQLKNTQIERKGEKLNDQDVVVVIKKQVKQRQDSIEQYKKGERQDLVEKESAELDILKSYLPEELSESQLQTIIDEIIKECQASSMKDMGTVIRSVIEKVAGNL